MSGILNEEGKRKKAAWNGVRRLVFRKDPFNPATFTNIHPAASVRGVL